MIERIELWSGLKPVVGVVHALPLPGSPRWGGSMDRVVDRALAEGRLMVEGGLHGLIAENYGDAPFFPGPVPAETVAAMAVLTKALVDEFPVPVGINVLRNDARTALGVAAATGARFVRINVHTGSMFTDQGLIQGRAHETIRARSSLDSGVAILADVLVKHATAPPGSSLTGAARDAWHRGLADGLILTGSETGQPVSTRELQEVREALPPEGRLWIGSGVTPESAATLLGEADGLIVGSALQKGGVAGGGVEADRVKGLMDALVR